MLGRRQLSCIVYTNNPISLTKKTVREKTLYELSAMKIEIKVNSRINAANKIVRSLSSSLNGDRIVRGGIVLGAWFGPKCRCSLSEFWLLQ